MRGRANVTRGSSFGTLTFGVCLQTGAYTSANIRLTAKLSFSAELALRYWVLIWSLEIT